MLHDIKGMHSGKSGKHCRTNLVLSLHRLIAGKKVKNRQRELYHNTQILIGSRFKQIVYKK